jgi:hypothetical protein
MAPPLHKKANRTSPDTKHPTTRPCLKRPQSGVKLPPDIKPYYDYKYTHDHDTSTP